MNHPDQQSLRFDGPDLDDRDHKTLNTQLENVRDFMLAQILWHTLAELEWALGFPQASISARLRDLRKAKFGGYQVEKRRRDGTRQREYRVKE